MSDSPTTITHSVAAKKYFIGHYAADYGALCADQFLLERWWATRKSKWWKSFVASLSGCSSKKNDMWYWHVLTHTPLIQVCYPKLWDSNVFPDGCWNSIVAFLALKISNFLAFVGSVRQSVRRVGTPSATAVGSRVPWSATARGLRSADLEGVPLEKGY